MIYYLSTFIAVIGAVIMPTMIGFSGSFLILSYLFPDPLSAVFASIIVRIRVENARGEKIC